MQTPAIYIHTANKYVMVLAHSRFLLVFVFSLFFKTTLFVSNYWESEDWTALDNNKNYVHVEKPEISLVK